MHSKKFIRPPFRFKYAKYILRYINSIFFSFFIIINPLTSLGEEVSVFIYSYLSEGVPSQGEAKGLIESFLFFSSSSFPTYFSIGIINSIILSKYSNIFLEFVFILYLLTL